MNVTDKLYTEWAWRSKTGTPSMDNPEDKAILDKLIAELTEQTESPYSQLQGNIAKIKDDPEAVEYLNRYVNSRRFRGPFNEYIAKQNIDSGTLEDTNAPDAIFNILSKNGDLEKYMENLDKLPGFGSLGSKGNLVAALDSIVSAESANALIRLGGTEGGRGVGKAELGLATLCKDVQMMKGEAGDLNWNGKYLEVKGTAARLGKRDRKFPGFDRSDLGILASKYDKSDTNLSTLITNLSNETDINLDELLNATINFAKTAHPKGNAENYFTKEILNNTKELNTAFFKNMAEDYIISNSIEHFLIWNTKPTTLASGKSGGNNFGDYVHFPASEMNNMLDNGTVRFSPLSVNGLDPSLSGGVPYL